MTKLAAPLLAAILFQCSAFAESQFDRDLKQLQDQHDKAVAAATEPLHRRYKEGLDKLLRYATQANDLDAAVKIKAEMVKLGFAATAEAGAPAIPNFTEKLLKQAWTWTSHPGGRDRLEFGRDGSVTHNGWKDATWVIKKPNTVIITMGASSATLRFNDAMTKFEGVDFGGTHPVTGEVF